MMITAEQKARDLLQRLGVKNAQSYTAGDLVELANLIARDDEAAALHTVPRRTTPKFFWVTIRYGNGFETTYYEKSEHHRRILIGFVQGLAEVVDQGEADWNRHV